MIVSVLRWGKDHTRSRNAESTSPASGGLRQLRQPVAQYLLRLDQCGRGVSIRIGPQALCADARGRGNLAGMADQPSLKSKSLRLRMKLTCKAIAIEAKGLVETDIGGRKTDSALWQVKRITVPVQDRMTRQG